MIDAVPLSCGVLLSTRVVKNDGYASVAKGNPREVKVEATTKESEDGRNINSDDGVASILQTHCDPCKHR